MTPLIETPKSSNVKAFGYDPAGSILAVHYKGNDHIHHYPDIKPEMAEELSKVHVAGGSVGAWLSRNVKHLPFTAIEV